MAANVLVVYILYLTRSLKFERLTERTKFHTKAKIIND